VLRHSVIVVINKALLTTLLLACLLALLLLKIKVAYVVFILFHLSRDIDYKYDNLRVIMFIY